MSYPPPIRSGSSLQHGRPDAPVDTRYVEARARLASVVVRFAAPWFMSRRTERPADNLRLRQPAI